MPSPYWLLRSTYLLLPEKLRLWPPLKRLSQRVVSTVASHEDIYTAEYYQRDVEGPARCAAPVISASIMRDFNPRRVVDLGCGTGALLEALKNHGCDCQGFEYSDSGLALCRSRGLHVAKFDIEHDSIPSQLGKFDVALSTEVAEHLPARCADRFVDVLASLAPVIVLTAATPGQGGTDHVNEQPHEYWIEKLKARGYQYELSRSQNWRWAWESAGIADFYYRNVMVFQRG